MSRKTNLLQKICSWMLCFVLLLQQTGFAEVVKQVNIAGYLLGTRNNLMPDKFRPMHLRYLQYLPAESGFKLLLDKGDYFSSKSSVVSHKNKDKKDLQLTTYDLQLKQETNKLMDYFAIGISLPNESFWVNLRPDSPDNIIDDSLAQTDIARIMLETDLQLKKDVAMMTSPETVEEEKYWDKLYKKAGELFGSENVTIPTLTRPWIVPDEVIIRESADSAYIYKATLKVMLEDDYLKDSNQKPVTSNQNITSRGLIHQTRETGMINHAPTDPRLKELNTYSTQLIRELIIPKITKAVNSSKRYAELRQVYYSLILAQWFKQRFDVGAGLVPARNNGRPQGPPLQDYTRLINSRDLTGLTSKTPWSKDTYYRAYQKSFKNGEYNIQKTVATPTGQVIRSYFSGGEMLNLGEKMPKGDVSAKNVAAGPFIVSLPAVSSAVKYNPLQMAAEEAILDKTTGKLAISGINRQNYELSRGIAVSSSMRQDDGPVDVFLGKMIKISAVGMVSALVAVLLYKSWVWVVPLGKKAQVKRDFYIAIAQQGSNNDAVLIDNFFFKVVDNDDAQRAIDGLKVFALNSREGKRAFIALEVLAKNGYKGADKAIESLAQESYSPAQEWLREHNVPPSQSSPLKCEKEIIETIVVGLRLITEGKTIKGAKIRGKTIEGIKFPDLEVPGYQHFVYNASTIAGEIQAMIYLESPTEAFYEQEVKPQDMQEVLKWYGKGSQSESVSQAKTEIIREINKLITEQENNKLRRLNLSSDIPTTRQDQLIEKYNQAIEILNNIDTYVAKLQENNDKVSSSLATEQETRVLTETLVFALWEINTSLVHTSEDMVTKIIDMVRKERAYIEFPHLNDYYREIVTPNIKEALSWLEKVDKQTIEKTKELLRAGIQEKIDNSNRQKRYNNTSYDDNTVKKLEEVIAVIKQLDTHIADLLNSSSSISSSSVGGIDFTVAYPIVSRAVNNLAVSAGSVPRDALLKVDLSRQWQQIEQVASSGIIVSSRKIADYLQASSVQDADIDVDKVNSCVSDRFRDEEENALPADPLLIDITAALLAAGSPVQLKAVFAGK